MPKGNPVGTSLKKIEGLKAKFAKAMSKASTSYTKIIEEIQALANGASKAAPSVTAAAAPAKKAAAPKAKTKAAKPTPVAAKKEEKAAKPAKTAKPAAKKSGGLPTIDGVAPPIAKGPGRPTADWVASRDAWVKAYKKATKVGTEFPADVVAYANAQIAKAGGAAPKAASTPKAKTVGKAKVDAASKKGAFEMPDDDGFSSVSDI